MKFVIEIETTRTETYIRKLLITLLSSTTHMKLISLKRWVPTGKNRKERKDVRWYKDLGIS